MYMRENSTIFEQVCSLESYRICIVSPYHFNAGLLSAHLDKSIGKSPCTMDLHDIVGLNRNLTNEDKTLYLLDCIALKDRDLLNNMHTVSNVMDKQDLLVVLNLSADINIEKQALDLGVKGFFYLNDDGNKLISGLRVVVGGGLWISRSKLETCYFSNSSGIASDRKMANILTARETELLNLLRRGWSNKDIAENLCISPFTVKTHLYKIYRKIKVHNRHDASMWAENNFTPALRN